MKVVKRQFIKNILATLFTTALILFVAAVLTVAPARAYASENSTFTVVNDDPEFAWDYDAEQNAYASTNKSFDAAGTSSSFSVVIATDGDLSFLYRTSSEDGWDRLTVYAVFGGVKSTVGKYSGDMAEYMPLTVSGLVAGDEVIFTYSKNKSKDRYEDTVYIKDLSVVAAVPAEVSLRVSAEGYGQILYEGNAAELWENITVGYGSPVTLTAVAGEGYAFIGWKNGNGELLTITPEYTAALTEDAELTAEFLPVGFSVSEVSATGGQLDWVQDGGVYGLSCSAHGEAKLTFHFSGEGCVSFCARVSANAESCFSVLIDGVKRYASQGEASINSDNGAPITLWVKGSGAHALTFEYTGAQPVGTGECGVSISKISFNKSPQTAELKIDYDTELVSVYIDCSGVGAEGYAALPDKGKITLPLGVRVVIHAELTTPALNSSEPWGWFINSDGERMTDGQNTLTLFLTAEGVYFEVEQGGKVNKVFSSLNAVEARYNEKALIPPPITRTLYIGRAEGGVSVTVNGEVFVTDSDGLIKIDFPADTLAAEYYNPAIETGRRVHTVNFGNGNFVELTEVAESVSLNPPTAEEATKVYAQDGGILRDFKLTATLLYYGGGTELIALTADRAGTSGVYAYEAALTAQTLKTVLYATVREAPASFAGFINSVKSLSEEPSERFLNAAQECRKQYLNLLIVGNAADREFASAYLSHYSEELGRIACTAEITSPVVYGDTKAEITVTRFNGSSKEFECAVTKDNYTVDGESGSALIRLGYTAEYSGKEYELITPFKMAERRLIEVVILSQSSIYGDPVVLDRMAYGASGVLDGDSPFVELYKEEGTAVGEYAIYGRLSDPFYTADFTNGVYTVKRRPVTYTVDDKTTVYGEETAALTASLTGGSLVEGEKPSINLYAQVEANSAVGEYEIYGKASSDQSYSITILKGKYTVTPRPVTVEIENQYSLYGSGQALDGGKYTAYGAVEGDDLKITLSREEGASAGTYPIYGKADNANYTVTFVNGVYTVTPRPVTVEIENQYSLYGSGQALDGGKYTAHGAVEGDDLKITLSREEDASVGAYPIYGKADNANYTVTFVNGVYTVMPRPVTVTVDSAAFAYGDEPVLSFKTQPYSEGGGLIAGDNLDVSVTADSDGSIGVHPVVCADEDDNYAVTFVGAAEYEIYPRPITVTVDCKSSVYGEELKELTYSVANAVAGEVPRITLYKAAGESVGEYAIYGECSSGVYRAEFKGGAYTVTPLPLTVSVYDESCEYGESVDLSYGISRTALPYGESAQNLFSITRELGEDAGRYAVTARALGNPNYELHFEYSDGVNRRSYYEIIPRAIEVSLNGVTVEAAASYKDLAKKLDFCITAGSTAGGEDKSTLGVKVYAAVDGEELTAQNCSALLKYGTYEIKGECENKNYAVSFLNGKLTVERRLVAVDGKYLDKFLADRTFTGSNLLNSFVWADEWKKVVVGFAESATQESFSISFKDKNGLLPVTHNNKGYAVPLAVSAGDYTAEIKINDSDIYAFSSGLEGAQSRVFPFEIEKMDISDSLKLNVFQDGKIVSGSDVHAIISADGYDVSPLINIRYDGRAVFNFYYTGTHTVTARVNEKNYCGAKSFTVTVIPSVEPKIEELKDLLNGYAEEGGAKNFEKMRLIFSGFTADDELQINATPSYKTVVEICNTSYSEFLSRVGQDAEIAHSVEDGCMPQAMSAYALISVFVGAVVAVKRFY